MLTIASIMETLMVVCFGLSWPLNIAKAWKARTAKGTSFLFYFFIWSGYVFAVIGKLCSIYYFIHIAGTAQVWTDVVKWYVMFFYVLNLVMVSGGILIYFRNVRLDSVNGGKKARGGICCEN